MEDSSSLICISHAYNYKRKEEKVVQEIFDEQYGKPLVALYRNFFLLL